MSATLQAPLIFGLFAAFVTTTGLIAVAQRADWSERHAGLFALAAAGMLVTLTLLHIAPEAFALSAYASWLMLAGFLGGLFLHYAVQTVFASEKGGGLGRAGAVTPLLAIAIHSFLDGVIYSITFANNVQSGVYAALSLILHEFPEGVIAFAILRRNQFSNREAFVLAFLASAVTTPLGVAISGPFVINLGAMFGGHLFAISAGLLLFVATGPLMAPLQEERPGRSFFALGGGVAVALAIMLIPLHGDPAHLHKHHKDVSLRALSQ